MPDRLGAPSLTSRKATIPRPEPEPPKTTSSAAT